MDEDIILKVWIEYIKDLKKERKSMKVIELNYIFIILVYDIVEKKIMVNFIVMLYLIVIWYIICFYLLYVCFIILKVYCFNYVCLK